MSFNVLGCHAQVRSARFSALARCFRIETVVASTTQTWRFTTAPCDHAVLEEDGTWHTYSPAQVVIRGTTRRSSQLQERSTELTIGTTGGSFTQDDVRRRFLDGAIVYEFLVDWRNWHRPPMQALRWRVLDWTPGRDSVKLDLGGVSNELKKDAGDAFGPACRWVFAGPGCDKAGTISGNANFGFRNYEIGAGTHTRNRFVIREKVLPDVFPFAATLVANWWQHGILRCSDSDNQYAQVVIASNTQPAVVGSVYAADFVSVTPLPFVPVEGDQITLQVGCNRSRGACGPKFGNLDQFKGFDYMPGSDFLRSSPEAS